MQRKYFFSGAIALVIVLVLGLFLYRAGFREPIPTAKLAAEQPEQKTVKETLPQMVAAEPADVPQLENSFLVYNLGPVQIEAFLDKYKRSSRALLAAWCMTRRRDLLEEAAKNYPNDPAVAMAAIANCVGGGREPWARKLIEFDPDNALGYMIACTSATERMDYDQVMSWLGTAVQASTFNDYSDEIRAWVKVAALDSGLNERKASAYAAKSADVMKGNMEYYIHLADEAANMISQQFVGRPEAEILKKSVEDLADYLMEEKPGSSLFFQVGGEILRKKMIDGLREAETKDPIYAGLRDKSENPEVFQKEMVNLKQSFNSSYWLLRASNDDVIEYYKRINDQGEFAALNWAMAKK